MSDYPNIAAVPTHISSMTPYFPVAESRYLAAAIPADSASAAWPAEKYALYLPFTLPFPYPIRRVFWGNGSAAGGEWSVGIYTAGFDLIESKNATAGSGNSAIQYATLETYLTPGSYNLGILHSATTVNHASMFTILAIGGRIMGCTEQNVASTTMPTAGTPIAWTRTFYPLCGFTRTSSGF